MKIKDFSYKHKDFYHNLKISLRNGSNLIIGANNRSIDFIVFDNRYDVELYKIITPLTDQYKEFWIEDLQDKYKNMWFRANYNLVFINEDGIEQKREKIKLN